MLHIIEFDMDSAVGQTVTLFSRLVPDLAAVAKLPSVTADFYPGTSRHVDS